jgi:hypothetical protein
MFLVDNAQSADNLVEPNVQGGTITDLRKVTEKEIHFIKQMKLIYSSLSRSVLVHRDQGSRRYSLRCTSYEAPWRVTFHSPQDATTSGLASFPVSSSLC